MSAKKLSVKKIKNIKGGMGVCTITLHIVTYAQRLSGITHCG